MKTLPLLIFNKRKVSSLRQKVSKTKSFENVEMILKYCPQNISVFYIYDFDSCVALYVTFTIWSTH